MHFGRAELTDHLEATTSHDGDIVVVTYSGSAEGEALGPLQLLLDNVHNDAVRTSVRQVVADLRALEFASSSCLKAFVTWLQRVQELDDDRRYQILFRSNPHHSWQRRSLGALAAFASGVVNIETEAV